MMRTDGKRTITVSNELKPIRRVVFDVSYVEGTAYGVVRINGMLRVVRQSSYGCKHWSRDTWQLSDVYQGKV